jgi:hypothetical protein
VGFKKTIRKGKALVSWPPELDAGAATRRYPRPEQQYKPDNYANDAKRIVHQDRENDSDHNQ